MGIHFASFEGTCHLIMEFLNINQYMSTNMREKMLKISNKRDFSKIVQN